MKILCVGNINYNIIFPLNEYPIENSKNYADKKVECGGGTMFNAAYLLGKWGMDVYLSGVIGNDAYGNKIIEELEGMNVNIKYLEVNNKLNTSISTSIINTMNGSNTEFTCKSEEMYLNELSLDFKPDIILLDGQEYDISKLLLKKYPSAVSIIYSNVPSEQVIELSGLTDYLICSKSFAETLTNTILDFKDSKTISSLYLKLKKVFSNQIIVTLENTGALYEDNHKIRIMKSLNLKQSSTLSSIDIFQGAFTYGVAMKLDLEEIIKISNITTALSMNEIGSINSIPSKEKMKLTLNEYK